MLLTFISLFDLIILTLIKFKKKIKKHLQELISKDTNLHYIFTFFFNRINI